MHDREKAYDAINNLGDKKVT